MNNIILDDLETIKNSINHTFLVGKTFLITGGNGTALSYLCYFLLYIGAKVILLVQNVEKCKEKYKYFKDNLTIIQNNLKLPLNIEQEIDYIIHGAGYASSYYFENFPVETIVPNTIGTFNLLALGKQKNIKKFLYISSTSVYGQTNKKELDEDYIGSIDFNKTKNCYMIAKQSGEILCKSFSKEYDLSIEIVRLMHNFGPTMDLENDKRCAAQLISNAVKNQDLIIKGTGKEKRSFIYTADTTIALLKILLNGNKTIYNISDKKNFISIKKLAEEINKCKNTKLKIKILGNKEKDNSFFAKPTNLKKLGWEPIFNLKTALTRTLLSYE